MQVLNIVCFDCHAYGEGIGVHYYSQTCTSPCQYKGPGTLCVVVLRYLFDCELIFLSDETNVRVKRSTISLSKLQKKKRT